MRWPGVTRGTLEVKEPPGINRARRPVGVWWRAIAGINTLDVCTFDKNLRLSGISFIRFFNFKVP